MNALKGHLHFFNACNNTAFLQLDKLVPRFLIMNIEVHANYQSFMNYQ